MTKQLPLPIGTRIIAVRNFGRIRAGQLGIISGIAEERHLEAFRPVYLCRFANNVKIAAQPNEIAKFSHAYSLADLEKSQF
jgi:hypothetical protein